MPGPGGLILLAMGGGLLGLAASTSSKAKAAPSSGTYELDAHLPDNYTQQTLGALQTVQDPATLRHLGAQMNGLGFPMAAAALDRRADEVDVHPAPAPGPSAVPGPAPVPPVPGASQGLDPTIDAATQAAVLQALASETDPAKLQGFGHSLAQTLPIAASLLVAKANAITAAQAGQPRQPGPPPPATIIAPGPTPTPAVAPSPAHPVPQTPHPYARRPPVVVIQQNQPTASSVPYVAPAPYAAPPPAAPSVPSATPPPAPGVPAVVATAGALVQWLHAHGCTQLPFAEAAAFQRAYNGTGPHTLLVVDGKYGALTQAALQTVIAPASAPQNCFPPAAPPAGPKPVPATIPSDIKSAAQGLVLDLQAHGSHQTPTPAATTFQRAYNSHYPVGPLVVDGKYGPLSQVALQSVLNWIGQGQTAPQNAFGPVTTKVPAFSPVLVAGARPAWGGFYATGSTPDDGEMTGYGSGFAEDNEKMDSVGWRGGRGFGGHGYGHYGHGHHGWHHRYPPPPPPEDVPDQGAPPPAPSPPFGAPSPPFTAGAYPPPPPAPDVTGRFGGHPSRVFGGHFGGWGARWGGSGWEHEPLPYFDDYPPPVDDSIPPHMVGYVPPPFGHFGWPLPPQGRFGRPFAPIGPFGRPLPPIGQFGRPYISPPIGPFGRPFVPPPPGPFGQPFARPWDGAYGRGYRYRPPYAPPAYVPPPPPWQAPAPPMTYAPSPPAPDWGPAPPPYAVAPAPPPAIVVPTIEGAPPGDGAPGDGAVPHVHWHRPAPPPVPPYGQVDPSAALPQDGSAPVDMGPPPGPPGALDQAPTTGAAWTYYSRERWGDRPGYDTRHYDPRWHGYGYGGAPGWQSIAEDVFAPGLTAPTSVSAVAQDLAAPIVAPFEQLAHLFGHHHAAPPPPNEAPPGYDQPYEEGSYEPPAEYGGAPSVAYPPPPWQEMPEPVPYAPPYGGFVRGPRAYEGSPFEGHPYEGHLFEAHAFVPGVPSPFEAHPFGPAAPHPYEAHSFAPGAPHAFAPGAPHPFEAHPFAPGEGHPLGPTHPASAPAHFASSMPATHGTPPTPGHPLAAAPAHPTATSPHPSAVPAAHPASSPAARPTAATHPATAAHPAGGHHAASGRGGGGFHGSADHGFRGHGHFPWGGGSWGAYNYGSGPYPQMSDDGDGDGPPPGWYPPDEAAQ